MAKVSTFFGAHPPTAAEMGRIYSGWISVEFWAPGRWRSLLGNLQGFAWKVRGGYSLLGTWTILFGLGSLSGPRHCSDRGPEAWASPSARTARAGWYQVHLVRLGTDVLLGIRWLPRGRGGSWVVPAPSAHAEGRVGFPPPPLPPSPPRTSPFPRRPRVVNAGPLKPAPGTKQPRKDAIKLSACQASYPSSQAVLLRRRPSATV